MTGGVLAAVLFAALLHASWNALVKGGGDSFGASAVVCLWCGLIAFVVAMVTPWPEAASYPFIIASAIVHVVYFLLVGRLYRHADLSAAYPVMRGVAPLLATLGAALTLGESVGWSGGAGIALLTGGVLWMAVEGARRGGLDGATLVIAFANSAVIALYTLIDGEGARLSGHAVAYNAWADALTAVGFAPILWRMRGFGFARFVVARWRRGLMGGAAAFGGYAIVVWAMTQAPIGLVAALRETSVMFAAVIGAAFLHEKFRAVRYVAAGFIAAGVIVLRLA